MKPRAHLLEKAVMPQDFAAANGLVRTLRSRAIGTAIADETKDLLAFVFRFINPGPAGGRGDDALASGCWIAPKEPLVLTVSQARTVFCDVGTVWITQGDGNDFVLHAGEKLILHPTDKVVVTAMAGPALLRHSAKIMATQVPGSC